MFFLVKSKSLQSLLVVEAFRKRCSLKIWHVYVPCHCKAYIKAFNEGKFEGLQAGRFI